MVEIRHLENRHDVIFFWRGWSELVKMSQTGAKWHVDCGYMVEIETRCSSAILEFFSNMADVWRLQWHVIPEPCITLQGAATWWIHCRDSKAICHIAGCSHLAKSVSWSCHIARCNNSISHIENRFSPYFICLLFSCSLCFDERRLSYRLRYTCIVLGGVSKFFPWARPGGALRRLRNVNLGPLISETTIELES